MLKISTEIFLMIMEVLSVSLIASVVMFFLYRKSKSSVQSAREAANKLQDDLSEHMKKTSELSDWKGKFDNLQQKFDWVKEINDKLKEVIKSIMPQDTKSGDPQKLLTDMELSRKDLDACTEELKREMKNMIDQIASYKEESESHKKESASHKEEITQLNKKLRDSVKKTEYDSMEAEKNRLELKVEQVENRMKEQKAELEKLNREHMALEKEFNHMYNNIDEDELKNLKDDQTRQPAES